MKQSICLNFLISLEGKNRHVDIKREGMNLYAHPLWHDWICRKISWEQAPALLHGPSPAMQCWAAAAGCWRQIPLLLHLRRTSPCACCWCPLPSPALWCRIFDGFFENCWAVFGNIFIHGRPCFLQVGSLLWFFVSWSCSSSGNKDFWEGLSRCGFTQIP